MLVGEGEGALSVSGLYRALVMSAWGEISEHRCPKKSLGEGTSAHEPAGHGCSSFNLSVLEFQGYLFRMNIGIRIVDYRALPLNPGAGTLHATRFAPWSA